MALDAANARVGITGSIWKAPFGTAIPTTQDEALNAAFVDLGYTDDSGVVLSPNDSVSDKVAWQNAVTIRSMTTESTLSLQFTMLETKRDTLEAYFRGSLVTEPTPGNYRMEIKPVTAQPSVFVFNIIDGLTVMRYVVANGEIVERGDINVSNEDVIGYPVTMRAYPDSNGNLMELLSNDAALAAA